MNFYQMKQDVLALLAQYPLMPKEVLLELAWLNGYNAAMKDEIESLKRGHKNETSI